jgi:rRNA-processing protein FCF1
MGTVDIPRCRVAVDTCFLISLADHDKVAWAALRALQKNRAWVCVPPTVAVELFALKNKGGRRGSLAEDALRSMTGWSIQPVDLIAVGHGIAERIADTIRSKGLLPEEERNDSLVLAEAALMDCVYLISSDKHLYEIRAFELRRVLGDFDVAQVEVVPTSRSGFIAANCK